MTTDDQIFLEASDTLFFEAEAPGGFLASLESKRMFDDMHWQRLWQAVASLVTSHNGELDSWARYDLTRIVNVVQTESANLNDHNHEDLSEFELNILEANLFIRNILVQE